MTVVVVLVEVVELVVLDVDVDVVASVVGGVVVVVVLDVNVVVVVEVLGEVAASVVDAAEGPAVVPARSLQAVAATRARTTTSATTRSLTHPT